MSIPTHDPSNDPNAQPGDGQQQQYGQLGASQPSYAQPVYDPNAQQQQPYAQQQPPYGQQQPPYAQQYQQPHGQGYGPSPQQASNGLGVAALVVGILALLAFWVPFLGVILGIVALVLGIIGRKRAKSGEASNGGMALAGIITGIVGAVLSITYTTILVVAFFVSGAGNYVSCVSNANGDQVQIQRCDIQFQRNS